MTEKNLSRRKFLKSGAIAAASAVFMNYPRAIFGQAHAKTRVVLIRDQNALDKNKKVNAEVIQRMLDDAVQTLFETNDAAAAWSKIIKPNDIVGIKSNVWNYLPTPRELENAIKRRVMDIGVSEKNISINDRGVLKDTVFKKSTALINTRPLRTHYWSGVGSLVKNYIMFVERPSDYHYDSCADLAAIWKLPHVKGKTRLNVLVMLTPLFHSVGPHGYNPDYVWQYKGIIVGVDPVACDAVGLKILEAKRREFFGKYKPLNPPAKHIGLADTRHNLGTADMNKIELIKLGLKEGILI